MIAYNRVGKTALQVPRLSFGSEPLAHPSFVKKVSREAALNTVRYAVAQGLNFIDSAPHYGFGQSESLVGEALKGTPRERYILATKVGRLVEPGVRSYFDYSRDGILRTIDESLHRLQVDRLDILHIHDPEDHFREALDNAYPILADLKRQRALHAIGAGMMQWPMLRDLALNADFDCFLLAGRYTLLDQGALDFLTFCQERQISVFLGAIYNGGILATGAIPGALYDYFPPSPEIVERVNRIEAICQRHAVPMRIVALRFASAHPAVTSVIVGLQTTLEVDEILKAWQTPVPAALWDDLRAAGLIHAAAPVPAIEVENGSEQ